MVLVRGHSIGDGERDCFIVPKNVFIPKPNVDSAALLTADQHPGPSHDKEAFQAFVQAGFMAQDLWNNLKSAYVPDL